MGRAVASMNLRCTMEQYIIRGGNPLVGEVEIGGAKNAALGIWQQPL